eukprot:529376_1
MFMAIVVPTIANGIVTASSKTIHAASMALRAVNDASTGTSAIMGTVADSTLSIGAQALGAAGIGSGVMLGFEVVLHSYRFWNGDIETWKEYNYCLASGLSASLGMGIGNWGGTVIGASIGSLGGPIGALIGGIIGGILGGARTG